MTLIIDYKYVVDTMENAIPISPFSRLLKPRYVIRVYDTSADSRNDESRGSKDSVPLKEIPIAVDLVPAKTRPSPSIAGCEIENDVGPPDCARGSFFERD